MNLFVCSILFVALNVLVPATSGVLVVTATAGTVLAVAGIAVLAKAKGVAIGAAAGAASSRSRGKRAVLEHSDEKKVWESVAQLEDSECVRRFLCEIATETFDAPDYEALIQDIVSNDKAEDVYSVAVKSGASHRDVEVCQATYPCPNTGLEIYEAYKNLDNN